MLLDQKLETLYGLRPSPSNRSEARQSYNTLLKKLGNPEKKLPPVIHVAGTNGKGSVIAIMRSILQAAGYCVHAFTSPHLIRFNERIILAGQEIDDAYLERLIDDAFLLDELNTTGFFEITTALAFKAFSETPADILLLETGIGGRHDCTNIIENPVATVITNISYDHMDILGNSLSDIAHEKSGIMKKNAPCIVGKQSSKEILNVFKKQAQKTGCPLYFDNHKEKPISLSLSGKHQQENARLALTTLKTMTGFKIDENAIKSGLQNIFWPGRLQKTRHIELQNGWELWLDGGHNKSAGQALATQAKEWQQDNKPLHLVAGIMNHKDPEAFLQPLASYTRSFTAVPIENIIGFVNPEILLSKSIACGFQSSSTAPNLLSALENIQKQEEPGRILICGSLYLVGQALKTLDQP